MTHGTAQIMMVYLKFYTTDGTTETAVLTLGNDQLTTLSGNVNNQRRSCNTICKFCNYNY